MSMTRWASALMVMLCLAAGAPGAADTSLGSPGLPPSQIDASGDLHEDWGVIGLRIEQPTGGTVSNQTSEASPLADVARSVTTTVTAGPVVLTTTAYRAPIWPGGVDVLAARIENTAEQEVQTRMHLALPEQTSVGERVASFGGRAVLGLPPELHPIRQERSWGCAGGDVPMPGWGHPEGECDPAFRNIRAGMGGVPIMYRFAVPRGAKRTVLLGLCESHHVDAGQRPVLLYVEGAPRAEIDPIAAWGRHQPGCLVFEAQDANSDGRLEVVSAPHPQAPDSNPILNVIWVFSPDVFVDADEAVRGKLSSVAEYYVDVGGENDQSLYEGGGLTYELALAPRASQEFMFLVACPGASVPNPETMAWTEQSLRRAAEDVWADCAAKNRRGPTGS
ncbi:MAG: hypothetical protein JSV65_09770 [Armatimonadota bacterium]|nr:MAG: hypothetical protein JSV65_09770 [Armatimonadota bacterium]